MPAVSVADPTTLPQIALGTQPVRYRSAMSVSRGPRGFEGEGFPVRRTMAGIDAALLDPFIMMDEMGEVDYAPGEPKGTPWHPHRGFETVTYLMDGVMEHQDSHGGGGTITNGDTQWMTAGSGILHIEKPPQWLVDSGGLFHGLQLWVNLPRAEKMVAPAYQDLPAGEVTLLASPDAGAIVRVIAGDVGGHVGPGRTHTPITMAHATVAPGARLDLPWRPDFNALVYVMSGHGVVGGNDAPVGPGHMVALGPGTAIRMSAREEQDAAHASGLEVIVLGGRPLREPVAWYGPFVMNTRAELLQAVEDYQAGRLGQPVE